MLKFGPTVPVGAVAVSSPPPNPAVELDRSSWLAAKLDPQVVSPAPGRHRLGLVLTLRCDHCRRELGFGVHRYWRMQFCPSACMTAYQQRLAPETKAKICRRDVIRKIRSAAPIFLSLAFHGRRFGVLTFTQYFDRPEFHAQ
jgi:hypothetical protein